MSVSAQVPRRTWALTELATPLGSGGNTGYVFRFDLLAPVLLIVLYITTG
jgi:hypothetical protein